MGSMIGGVSFALFYKYAELMACGSMLICTGGKNILHSKSYDDYIFTDVGWLYI